MSMVTILPSGKTIEAGEGDSLLSVILRADGGFSHKCEGKASCGTCHVFVHGGRKGLSRIAREENDKLDTLIGVGAKSRLACQALVLGTEDVTVELLSFASGI
ncbi:MAG: 2Fe-2S iron-sulfur cluster binding domain-containing protein [Telmatospirillum sp.]|nr:2Fe-2S iron-sulfur cluster binding domain-containing protein [Telmatospirillum sp.]